MAQAQTPADALEIVAGSIVDDTRQAAPTSRSSTMELDTLAARDASFRDITERWMDRTRGVLEKHFDPLTARLLDALVEGLAVHRTLDRNPVTTAQMIEGIRRITKEATPW